MVGLGSGASLFSNAKLWLCLILRSSGAARSKNMVSDRTRLGELCIEPVLGLWFPWFWLCSSSLTTWERIDDKKAQKLKYCIYIPRKL